MATNHCNILAFSPQASTGSHSLDLAMMAFPAAATAWLARREPYIAAKDFSQVTWDAVESIITVRV